MRSEMRSAGVDQTSEIDFGRRSNNPPIRSSRQLDPSGSRSDRPVGWPRVRGRWLHGRSDSGTAGWRPRSTRLPVARTRRTRVPLQQPPPCRFRQRRCRWRGSHRSVPMPVRSAGGAGCSTDLDRGTECSALCRFASIGCWGSRRWRFSDDGSLTAGSVTVAGSSEELHDRETASTGAWFPSVSEVRREQRVMRPKAPTRR
jgi:hypothetical protein